MMYYKLLIIILLFLASGCMIFAWIGHLKYDFNFVVAFLFSWFIVIPEYLLNTYATRISKEFGIFKPLELSFLSIIFGIFFTYIISIYFFKRAVSLNDFIGGFFIVIGAFFIFL